MNAPEKVLPRHFYSLDALRGLAALAVVCWHWQYFFYVGFQPAGFRQERQPFFALLHPLYTDGWRAVSVFFCLSGFIFFWLYADGIARRAVSWRQFAVRRWSRLYPLHLTTLLFVAAAQAGFRRVDGHDFAFPHNDGWHFALQLLLASNWGRGEDFSFNAPVWSVSVEIFLYGVFFLACLAGWRRWWQLVPLVGAGYVCIQHGESELGSGLLSFFAGGLTFLLCGGLARRGVPGWLPPLLAAATVFLWLGMPFFVQVDPLPAACRDWHWHVHGKDVLGALLTKTNQLLPTLVIQPLTILTLALWEMRRGTLGRRFAFLGQISYSSYLLHFPLLIVFLAADRRLAMPVTVFYTRISFVLFFAVLVPLSLASFHCFELPCQGWLRAKWLPGTRTDSNGLTPDLPRRTGRQIPVKEH